MSVQKRVPGGDSRPARHCGAWSHSETGYGWIWIASRAWC